MVAPSARKSSSPSFRLIELTTPLPWMQRSPASSTVHFDESIMTGTLAMAGSVATRFRNRVIVASPSIRSASMLTSIRFAPFSTCWRATSTAAAKSPDSISPAKIFEPVMFVRSPTITKPVSGVIRNGSRPANEGTGGVRAGGGGGEGGGGARGGPPARRNGGGGGGNHRDVLGRGAATPSDEVD